MTSSSHTSEDVVHLLLTLLGQHPQLPLVLLPQPGELLFLLLLLPAPESAQSILNLSIGQSVPSLTTISY